MSTTDTIVMFGFIVVPVLYIGCVGVLLYRVCTILEPLARAVERAERAKELSEIQSRVGRLQ